jgi:hypothetical protein
MNTIYFRNRGALWPAKPLSQKRLEEVFFSLPADRKRVLKLRLGFNDSGKFYTLAGVAAKLRVSNERVRQIFNDALSQVQDSPQDIFGMRRLIIDAATAQLEKRIVISVAELEKAVVKQRLSDTEEVKFVLPILFLSDFIFGKELDYLDLKRGEVFPPLPGKTWLWRKMQRDSLGLTQEPDKYYEILPRFCREGYRKEEGGMMSANFGRYQERLEKQMGLPVSLEELRLVVGLNEQAAVAGEYFFAVKYCKEEITMRRLANLIEEQGSPLHFKRLARLLGMMGEAKGWQTVHVLLQKSDLFVLVGNGIYDLAENHPELTGVPDPGYRKTSPAFGVTYVVLRDAKEKLAPHEIIKIIKENYPRFCLSESAIYRILSAENYQQFFREENGKWGLRE